MNMEPVKLIVAGSANPHVPGYLRGKNPWINIIAVSDFDEARLNNDREFVKNNHNPVFYTDWRKMLDSHPEAEGIIIGSDNKHHMEMFKEAVSRDLHIYSMKVPTMDESEGAEMLRLTKDYKRVIQVELELHFSPQFRYARDLILSGKLGKVESIYLTNVSQCPLNYFPNWGDPELSYGKTVPIRPGADIFRGGALTDHPHPFDLIRWITGDEFKKIFAVSAVNQRSHIKVEDHIAMTGELVSGTKIFINPSYSNLEEKVPTRRLRWPKSLECNLKITGTKGYYATDYYDKPLYVVGPKYQSPDRLIVDMTGRFKPDKYDCLMGCFSSCVRGRRERPETTLQDGLAAVKVMNAAYESVYRNEEVYL